MKKRATIFATATLIAALFFVALFAMLQTPAAQAQDDEPDAPTAAEDRFITVSGLGTASVTPDQAVIRLGVVTDAPTATQALEENGELVQEVISATQGLDIPEEQIQTEFLRLEPVREQETTPETQPLPPGPVEPGEITGYRASNIVAVTVNDLDILGDLIDTAVAAGANTIQGIRFDVSDSETLASDARLEAVQNAQQKAEELADAAGATLGDVIAIRDLSGDAVPLGIQADAVQAEGGSFPVQSGQQTIEVRVEVTWALE
jgi:uncharacterized protein YggE